MAIVRATLHLLVGLIGVVCSAQIVHAQNTWTGFYVGAHAGYAWQRDNVAVTSQNPAVFGEQPFIVGLPSDGAVGGAQVGVNWQFAPHWVTGIEADFSRSKSSGDARNNSIFTDTGAPLPGAYHDVHQHMQWFATVRGRLGYLVSNNLLLFGTGGFAYGRADESALHDYTGTGASFSTFTGASRSTMVGWTAGGGAELQLGGNWSAKIDYLYFDLGDDTITQRRVLVLANDPQTLFSTFHQHGNLVRVGINYTFGWLP